MSLDHDIAPMCKLKRCTNLSTSRAEYENKICDACMFDLQEKWDAEDEEKKIKIDKEK